MLKAFVLISVIYITLHAANATSFECGDEPAACKTKFGAQFEKGFREIHLNGVRKYLTTYIDKMSAVKAQIKSDSPFVEKTESIINNEKQLLQKFNDNVQNDEKYGEAIKEAMSEKEWDVMENTKDTPGREEYQKLMEPLNLHITLLDVVKNIGLDTGNLWADMYKGLREEDLKAYPEYADVNEFMNNLRGKGKRPGQGSDYSQAAEILADKFGLNFFKIVIIFLK